MTNDRHVKAETLRMVRKTLEPGRAITSKVWKMNYDLVRAQAIADTVIWKQLHITIERV
jgi:hypothetical protein